MAGRAKSGRSWRIILFLLFVLFMIFFLYPLWIGIAGSFKTTMQVMNSKVYAFSFPLHFDSYIRAFSILRNPLAISLKLGIYVTVFTIILGVLGGYSLSICKFKGQRLLFVLCLFGIYIPPVTKMLPALKLSQWMGLYNTIFGLGLITGSMLMTTATIIYREFFTRIPKAMIEAAKIEGANHIDILLRLMVPMLASPSISVFVMAFATGWNNYMMALVLTRGNISSRPVALSVATLKDLALFESNYSVMLAGGLLTVLPPVLLYIFCQRYVRTGSVRDNDTADK
jgi:glucose/mannose transport system permease protein